MKTRLRSAIGMQVTTTGHQHPDVLPGTTGAIESIMGDGYGVKFKSLTWLDAGANQGGVVKETRTVWLDAKNLKVIC